MTPTCAKLNEVAAIILHRGFVPRMRNSRNVLLYTIVNLERMLMSQGFNQKNDNLHE